MTSTHEAPHSGYRWDAAEYARHSAGQLAWARELIPKLALAGDEQVLDIGCGDGKVTAAIADCLPRGGILGMDSSPGMVDLARGRFPRDTHPQPGFHPHGRAPPGSRLPVSIRFFPMPRSIGSAITGVPAPHPEALRPGGRMLFQMGGRGNAADIVTRRLPRDGPAEWAPHFTDFAFPYGFHGPEEYEGWLHEAGFVPRRLELMEKDLCHEGADGLADGSAPPGYPGPTACPRRPGSPLSPNSSPNTCGITPWMPMGAAMSA